MPWPVPPARRWGNFDLVVQLALSDVAGPLYQGSNSGGQRAGQRRTDDRGDKGRDAHPVDGGPGQPSCRPQRRFDPTFDDHAQAERQRRYIGADDRVATTFVFSHESCGRQLAGLALR